ncbi:flavin monoamine oxidase family protein [Rhodococcus sp. NPDC056960]|uniref:flavin monoamine oxidase family protein n=1 Tax=Rhodococcus sp. NPDC056960 TaxID=3345982 RepID=UPI00362E4A50
MPDYDVIIVGGGLAGLVAARELRMLDQRVLLLEAKDHLGGRAWTADWDGSPIEMGAMNVHWLNPHLWAEIMRYRLEVVEVGSFSTFALAHDDGLTRLAAHEALTHLGKGLEAFFRGLGESIPRPFDPWFDIDALVAMDELSVSSRVEQLDLTSEERAWLEAWMTVRTSGLRDQAGVSSLVKHYAMAGHSLNRMLEMSSRFRLAGGMKALVDSIAADSRAHIRLGSPVARIVHDETSVAVHTEAGETYTALACIVATPPTIWPTLDVDPKLPARRTDADEVYATPHLTKIWALAEGEVEDLFVLRADRTDAPLVHARKDIVRPDGLTTILGFSLSDGLDTGDKDKLAKEFETIFPLPRAKIVDVFSHDWGSDVYARGGQHHLRPRQLSQTVPYLQTAESRLVFASAELANALVGVDGALQSGTHAARRVGELLTTHRR